MARGESPGDSGVRRMKRSSKQAAAPSFKANKHAGLLFFTSAYAPGLKDDFRNWG